MKNVNILIVEDEAIVAQDLKLTVLELGYKVTSISSSYEDTINVYKDNNIDIILMDIYLKGNEDGIDTAREILKIDKNVSIIYTTAMSDTHTIKRAINTKPSSYLIKPIKIQELSIALQIAQTNFDINKSLSDEDLLIGDNFIFNITTNILTNKDIHTPLTKKETQILALLIKSKNNLVSFYEIENEIWPDKSVTQSTIRSLVSRLKSKLNHRFISSISQFGYKIEINK